MKVSSKKVTSLVYNFTSYNFFNIHSDNQSIFLSLPTLLFFLKEFKINVCLSS